MTAAGAPAGPSTEGSGSGTLLDGHGATIDQDTAAYYLRVRAGFGFPAGPTEVQRIIDEYGVAFEWGFPLTPSELAELHRRLEIADRVTDEVLEGIWSLPGFAGFYFDHLNGGRPTVLTTRIIDAGATVRESVPATVADELVLVAAAHTRIELELAARAITQSDDPYLTAHVHRVAIKTITNSLAISIADESVLGKVAEAIATLTSVPFEITVEPISEPLACSSRSICYDPHRAGIEVNGGPANSTLGFGLSHDGDRQYAVTGHHIASSYTHYIFVLGSTAESEFVVNGIDVRAVYAPDSQVSDDVYVTSTFTRDVIGSKYPSMGLAVCKSGVATGVTCGAIVDDLLTYTTQGVSGLTGATANFSVAIGDSGAPVYQISGSSSAWAVGMVSAGGGDTEIVRTYDFFGRMGAFVLAS